VLMHIWIEQTNSTSFYLFFTDRVNTYLFLYFKNILKKLYIFKLYIFNIFISNPKKFKNKSIFDNMNRYCRALYH